MKTTGRSPRSSRGWASNHRELQPCELYSTAQVTFQASWRAHRMTRSAARAYHVRERCRIRVDVDQRSLDANHSNARSAEDLNEGRHAPTASLGWLIQPPVRTQEYPSSSWPSLRSPRKARLNASLIRRRRRISVAARTTASSRSSIAMMRFSGCSAFSISSW